MLEFDEVAPLVLELHARPITAQRQSTASYCLVCDLLRGTSSCAVHVHATDRRCTHRGAHEQAPVSRVLTDNLPCADPMLCHAHPQRILLLRRPYSVVPDFGHTPGQRELLLSAAASTDASSQHWRPRAARWNPTERAPTVEVSGRKRAQRLLHSSPLIAELA